MTLRTMMQAGPARANELFSKLAETSDGAVKTRERLFAELKAELELHASLEEQHLFFLTTEELEGALALGEFRCQSWAATMALALLAYRRKKS